MERRCLSELREQTMYPRDWALAVVCVLVLASLPLALLVLMLLMLLLSTSSSILLVSQCPLNGHLHEHPGSARGLGVLTRMLFILETQLKETLRKCLLKMRLYLCEVVKCLYIFIFSLHDS